MINKWETDATDINPDEIGQLLFENGEVQTYLRQSNAYVLSACKGVGKSLLLMRKRFLLENKHISDQEHDKGAIFIPKDKPYRNNFV